MEKKFILTLGILLSVTSENNDVEVCNLEGELIAFYDGKNSIPTELNEYEVFRQEVDNKKLKVTIYK